jgi:polar amino acid transport system permease protein
MGFDPSEIPGMLPELLGGLRVTILLTLLIMAIALVVALPIALARMSRLWVVRAPATIYVQVLRGTPVYLQLFYLYYVLPFAGIKLDPYVAGVTGLSLSASAYLSETYRSGIQAIDRGQTEAALSLGMSRIQVMRLIVIPQAFRIMIPPIGNTFISMFKDTSLMSILTIQELMYTGQVMAAVSFRYTTIFTVVLVLYLIVCWPTATLIDRLEKRLNTIPPPRNERSGPRQWRIGRFKLRGDRA